MRDSSEQNLVPELVCIQNFSQQDFVEIPGVYYAISVVMPVETEMTDQELRVLGLQSKSYDFWKTDVDDIYSLSDGTPL